jgi:hypothetical protein
MTNHMFHSELLNDLGKTIQQSQSFAELEKWGEDLRALENLLRKAGIESTQEVGGIFFEDGRIRLAPISIDSRPIIECKVAMRRHMMRVGSLEKFATHVADCLCRGEPC